MPFPAARVTDFHVCPMMDGPKPHVGGPVMPPGHPTVLIGSLFSARGTDQATCAGPPDFIVTGAGTVHIGGKPAARLTDTTMHGGKVILGCFTVLIGGPTSGVTLGNPAAGEAACQAAASGRSSGSTQQSHGNCGVETSRQIINQATGSNVGEQDLLQDALTSSPRRADPGPGDPNDPSTWTSDTGSTLSAQRESILEENGVAASRVDPTVDNMEQAVAEGRGVDVSVWAGTLWTHQSDIPPGTGGHQVLVTGLEYDANGRLVTVIANDTGRLSSEGNCSVRYPADLFESSMIGGANRHVVTDNPIW